MSNKQDMRLQIGAAEILAVDAMRSEISTRHLREIARLARRVLDKLDESVGSDLPTHEKG